jgi:hypothetical protein
MVFLRRGLRLRLLRGQASRSPARRLCNSDCEGESILTSDAVTGIPAFLLSRSETQQIPTPGPTAQGSPCVSPAPPDGSGGAALRGSHCAGRCSASTQAERRMGARRGGALPGKPSGAGLWPPGSSLEGSGGASGRASAASQRSHHDHAWPASSAHEMHKPPPAAGPCLSPGSPAGPAR